MDPFVLEGGTDASRGGDAPLPDARERRTSAALVSGQTRLPAKLAWIPIVSFVSSALRFSTLSSRDMSDDSLRASLGRLAIVSVVTAGGTVVGATSVGWAGGAVTASKM